MLGSVCFAEILSGKSWIWTLIQFFLAIRDFFYSMHECLSTHDNPSVQNKSYVSLKPVNLKPFYIKPYLTHEIKFAEAEMEKK